MSIIYESSFFLALGLLAIEGTIFIFAISMLGRAMEAAVAKEKEKLAENSRTNTEELESIKKEISEAQASNVIPSELTRKLKKLERRGRHLARELHRIRLAPNLLTVSGGLLPTAILLVVAIILSVVAWQLSDITAPAPVPTPITTIIWAVGLIGIGFGTVRIYKTMKVVEDVAITSEEAALRRTVDAFIMAQVELERERKPIVNISFSNIQFPLKMTANSELYLQFTVEVVKGIVRNGVIYLAAPEGFQFSDCEFAFTALGDEGIRPVAAKVDLPDVIISGTFRRAGFTLTAPSTLGKHSLTYNLKYQDDTSGRIEYEVEVVPEVS